MNRVWVLLLSGMFAGFSLFAAKGVAQPGTDGGSMTWAIKYDPKTLDPAKVDDQVSETVRYLTGGVLLRLNRVTQQVEPSLAESWKVSGDGRSVTFHLRSGTHFSDGSPISQADVVASLRRVLDPAIHAPAAEEFIDPRGATVQGIGVNDVVVHLSKRVVGVGKVFDEIAIQPRLKLGDGAVSSGPFTIRDYKRGEYLVLARNAYFWKKDKDGRPLPYLSSLRLDVLANPEQEQLRFLRKQYQVLNSVVPDNFAMLRGKFPEGIQDAGQGINTEQMWFNQSDAAPLPVWEKAWFRSKAFRNAISLSISRKDLVRIAYAGHASPASGFVSPANTVWFNKSLQLTEQDTAKALRLLSAEGFHKQGNSLLDKSGRPVSFSILTNAGNRQREKMAVLIQQDLGTIGIKVNVVSLDFPALIDRLMHAQDYEAVLLGLSDVEPDPSSMMNVWLSSSPNHQWNPSEKVPATDWEAEIDRLMKQQSETAQDTERKRLVDRVQEIVADQQPFIYLVYPNMLYGVSPDLTGVQLSVLQPGVISNIEGIHWKAGAK